MRKENLFGVTHREASVSSQGKRRAVGSEAILPFACNGAGSITDVVQSLTLIMHLPSHRWKGPFIHFFKAALLSLLIEGKENSLFLTVS